MNGIQMNHFYFHISTTSIHSTHSSLPIINMIKLLLLSALCGLALAGYAQQQHGHGGGYGHGASQHGGHGHGHGHGWHRPYHGWANVNVWQTPHGYQFGLNEQGSGYNKYVWQGADYQNSHAVKTYHQGGHGHGHGYQG